MSSPAEARKFHEAERHHHVLSHSDFAKEEDFEFLEDIDELNDYLLEKNWDKFFIMQKSGAVTCDIVIANKVFEQCYSHFCKKIDTVQLFHTITDFYNIDGHTFFNKLVRLHRDRLVSDLEKRIGKLKSNKTMLSNDRIQLAFSLILNKKR